MNDINEIWNALLAKKLAVLKLVAENNNNNTELRRLTEWLRRELDLEGKRESLLSEAGKLISELKTEEVETFVEQQTVDKLSSERTEDWSFASLEKGERAFVAVSSYLNRELASGNEIKKAGRALHRNREGVLIGITYSSKKQNGGWFLNLKYGTFKEAVLLCEIGPQSVKVVHLPSHIIERYQNNLSKEKKYDMLKFNVRQNKDRWELMVPQPVGAVDITDYVELGDLRCERIQYK